MQTTIFFIRHGESRANKKHVYQGLTIDSALTEKGREQARAFKKNFSEKIDAVYSSPAKRCLETAEIIFGNNIKLDERLMERGLGEWEGMEREEIKERFPKEFEQYNKNRDMANIKGAEPYEKIEERIRDFFEEILSTHKGKMIAIVGHAGVGKVLLKMVLKLPREKIAELEIGNSATKKIVFNGTKIESGKIVEEGE